LPALLLVQCERPATGPAITAGEQIFLPDSERGRQHFTPQCEEAAPQFFLEAGRTTLGCQNGVEKAVMAVTEQKTGERKPAKSVWSDLISRQTIDLETWSQHFVFI
jgi:hypothetical protein